MIEQLIRLCRNEPDTNICILMHNFPDADAVSSAMGLQYILKENGIPSAVYYSGRIDRISTQKLTSVFHLDYLPTSGAFSEKDRIITIDCRAGEGNVTLEAGKVIACIDHHTALKGCRTDFEYIQHRICGACASMIAAEIQALGLPIPEDIATALLFGIKMDTLSFTRGVEDIDIDMFKYLRKKANEETLHALETSNMVASDLKAFGSTIENILVIADIGVSYVPFDCPDGLIAMLTEFMLGLDEIGLAAVFSKGADGIKLSVRTILPFVDAGEFVHEVLDGIGSGGGHKMSAGGFIPNASLTRFQGQDLNRVLKDSFLRAYGSFLIRSDDETMDEKE